MAASTGELGVSSDSTGKDKSPSMSSTFGSGRLEHTVSDVSITESTAKALLEGFVTVFEDQLKSGLLSLSRIFRELCHCYGIQLATWIRRLPKVCGSSRSMESCFSLEGGTPHLNKICWLGKVYSGALKLLKGFKALLVALLRRVVVQIEPEILQALVGEREASSFAVAASTLARSRDPDQESATGLISKRKRSSTLVAQKQPKAKLSKSLSNMSEAHVDAKLSKSLSNMSEAHVDVSKLQGTLEATSSSSSMEQYQLFPFLGSL
ncbi:hypothetical protein ACH5RR_041171 [Cinchona calisaya]|uniref:Uncharacterized protein n=1 Tax=Cinchona calisaya TaxID=153742 RepID=A0ABD2XYR7_9GENT